MTKKTIIVDEFHQGASAQAYRDGVQQMHDAVSDIHTQNDGIAPIAEGETGEVIHTFETTFYDPLLKSLREFYDNEESGNHSFEVITGEEYMRQLAADSAGMNKHNSAKE
ncbi:hypothetical protein PSP6_690125 [Paraburkholderia tropica]|uniref:hypothetical protein n=1 Tax=Paraburkholderia tropica TaxID=92647 RepID=UPI001CB28C3C|nr:hypothetical protein [Paraburkholderia tropica]CAG9236020.1 hypothetical protein PSP6_690125 [Paraburkholderia tropica]